MPDGSAERPNALPRSWPRRACLAGGLLGLAVVLLPLMTLAEEASDVVVLGGRDGRGTTTVTGIITHLNRDAVRLTNPLGRESEFPAERIVEVRPRLSARAKQAEQLEQAHDYNAALRAYDEALAEETRAWMQPRLAAAQVRCLVNLGRTADAIDRFVSLFRAEPRLRELGVIPLDWTGQEPSGRLEAKLAGWLSERAAPVERLIAASHLMTAGGQRGRVRFTLESLAEGDHPELALLAQWQLKRLTLHELGAADLVAWQRRIEQAPSDIQAGGWWLLGRAWSIHQNHEQAALCWMRVAILFGDQRRLAVDALLAAGVALQSHGQSAQAEQVFREIVRDYADFPTAAATAQRYLSEANAGR